MTCIHELFEAQVDQAPDAIAVVFGDTKLTYRELNRHADALAYRLRGLGLRRDVLAALYFERSLDMVVGMLGVLKAGGAYVPLDPIHPRKRLAHMLADAQPLAILTQERLQSGLPPHRSQVVAIDAVAPLPVEAVPPSQASSPRDLAYVIYTSGSTGEPKGVEIEHGAVVNMLTSMQRQPGLVAGDSMLAITTLAFDIAALEVFLPLVCGASVVIASSEIVIDGEALASLIARSGVSVMQTTPSTLRMLLDAGWKGDPRLKILCGGEAWTPELARQLLPRCGSLWNMYGPTETTVWSAIAKVEAGRPITIGRPIANTQLYVLDGALQLVPVGVPGELFIGGKGLARGYLHRPELTRESFKPDPYAAQPEARMYRTGDLVRRQPNGTLEFLGRLDYQVKVRGHRIELGEIEAALVRQPGIERCVVVAGKDKRSGLRLVAYLIPAQGTTVSPAELRLALGETLPSYMIPSAFVSLTALPLTPNGKLDRKALPPPEALAEDVDTALEPRTPTEKLLARIWCEILDRTQNVGIRDNFFDLGGHSLMAVRVAGEINKKLKVRLSIPVFFENPTIERLARVIEEKHYATAASQVLPLQQGHTGLPIYFMGAGPQEYQVARLISAERPIFAVDAPMPEEWFRAITAGNRKALPSIEQLGVLYGNILRGHVGLSPCVVAGYSLGGKIAFEAARVLQRAGGRVAFVLLLDAWAFTWSGAIRGPALQSLLSIWRMTHGTAGGSSTIGRLGVSASDFWRLLGWIFARMPQAVAHRFRRAPNHPRPSRFLDGEGTPIDQTLIDRLIRTAGRSWQPQPLNTKGVLFRATFRDEGLPGHDFSNGWRDLFTEGLEIFQATGDHLSMVAHENVSTLAQQINDVLDRYDTVGNVTTSKLGDVVTAAFPAQESTFHQGLSEAKFAATPPPT